MCQPTSSVALATELVAYTQTIFREYSIQTR